MQLFYCPTIDDKDLHLNPEESRHCLKVLRKRPGDLIRITNGRGSIFQSQIIGLTVNSCIFKILAQEQVDKPKFAVHIAIAATKSLERIEWFIEKAVEIGVQKITFIDTRYSERKSIKIERIRKKAISAMKQSNRAFLPTIRDMQKLSTFVDSSMEEQRFVAHLEGEQTHHLKDLAKASKDVLVIIGPEGGFSDEELVFLQKMKFNPVRLGDYRLRTETAGIVACVTLANLKVHE